MLKNLIPIFLSSLVLACSESKKELPAEDPPLITFDMTKLEQHRVTAPIIKNRKFIPLEFHEDAIIGYVNKVLIQDDRIYVFDRHKSRALFVFGIDGRFLFRVGRRGKGPGEYIYLYDFDLDEQGNIYLLNGIASGFKIMKFDHSGSFISKRQNTSFYVSAFAYPHKENVAFFTRNNESNRSMDKELGYEVLYSDFEGITGRYIPDSIFVDSELEQKMPLNFYKSPPDNYLYASIFDYDIYQVGQQGLSKKYAFDFGSKELPEDIEIRKSIAGSIEGNDKYVWRFMNIYENDHFFTFMFIIDGRPVKFYYSKERNNYFVKDGIDVNNEEAFSYSGRMGIYEDQLIGIVQVRNFLRMEGILADPDSYAHEYLKNQDTSYLDDIDNPEEANPVIVLYEIDWSVMDNIKPM